MVDGFQPDLIPEWLLRKKGDQVVLRAVRIIRETTLKKETLDAPEPKTDE